LFKASPQVVVSALFLGRFPSIASRAIEGATTNQGQRHYAPGMRSDVNERRHRTSGVTHQGWPFALALPFHQLMEIINVARNDQGIASGA